MGGERERERERERKRERERERKEFPKFGPDSRVPIFQVKKIVNLIEYDDQDCFSYN